MADDDICFTENAALKRKLQSKAEALQILSRELANCRRERDSYKEFIKKEHSSKIQETPDVVHQNEIINSQVEVAELKKKLKALQNQVKELQKEGVCQSGVSWHRREELIEELEESKLRVKELNADLQALLDEKEELVTERDAYKCKVHRLNHEISTLLKSNMVIDFDTLIMENKYLKERLDQLMADKEMSQNTLSKYKAMLDKKKLKGAVKLGSNINCGGLIVTHKQVQELLENDVSAWKTTPDKMESTLADLRSLSQALLESLQDKTLALIHLKKTNKILGDRVTTLETELSKASPVFPSQILIDGYTCLQIDKELNNASIIQEYKDKLKNEKSFSEEDNERLSNDEHLPPELQELVQKAMEEINLNTDVNS